MMTPLQKETWIEKYAPMAQASQYSTGVPASVTMAQAIIESSDRKGNWGCSGVALRCNNFFGIKARHNRQGDPIDPYVEFKTVEDLPTPHEESADFMKFDSVQDSFARHAQLLTTTRYQKALLWKNNPSRFAEEIWKAGYSTNPHYPEVLMTLIVGYQLMKYDVPPIPPASGAQAKEIAA